MQYEKKDKVVQGLIWDTLGPGIHTGVSLTHTNERNIVTDQVHPFMAMVFPKGIGIINLATLHMLFRNGSGNMTKSCGWSPGFQISPELLSHRHNDV